MTPWILATALLGALLCASEGVADEASEMLSGKDVRPGVCIVAGAQDGARLLDLACDGKFLVHGLALSDADLVKTRASVREGGVYGPVSAALLRGDSLPYADNTINALVVEDYGALRDRGISAAELLRPVAPYGCMLIRAADAGAVRNALGDMGDDLYAVSQDGNWLRIVKAFPREMADWNQYACDPARSFVSQDRLAGPLESIRWIAGETMYTGRYVSPNVIAAGGRTFLLYTDRGYKGCVEARDGFNGRLLWRTSPHEGVRDFVADGERLYVMKGALEAWDAATGEKLFTFEHPNIGWHRILLDEESGILVFMSALYQWAIGYEAGTGKQLWQVDGLTKAGYRSGKGVMGGGRFYYSHQNDVLGGKPTYSVRALDVRTGDHAWTTDILFGDASIPITVSQYLDGKVVARAPGEGKTGVCKTEVLDAGTGRKLWTTTTDRLMGSDGGFFLLDNMFWTHEQPDLIAYEPNTGKEVKRISSEARTIHTGCDPMVATVEYMIGARMHFIDPETGEFFRQSVTRTPCRDSVRVANGLTYFPRHTCACANQMNGNIAIAARPAFDGEPEPYDAPTRFVRGPAYGVERSLADAPAPWPTYRANGQRGAVTGHEVSADLAEKWTVRIGSSASAPVAGGGRVFVADAEGHTLVALDEDDGSEAWRFTAGARIDSPPTFHEGLLLFGCRDGWLYCLDASDGRLAWRFRAAPADRRIVVQEQFESIWPVYGSVLVEDGLAYASAGRHVDIDGGLWIYALQPETGRVVWVRNVRNEPHTVESAISSRLRGEGAINDILRSDGRHVYLAGSFEKVAFDLKTGERIPGTETLGRTRAWESHTSGTGGVKSTGPGKDGVPVHEVRGPGVLTDWLILGPFPGGGLDVDFLQALGGEAGAAITSATTVAYEAEDGTPGEAKAELVDGAETSITITPPYDEDTQKNSTFYAVCRVELPEARTLRGVFSASGSEKVFVNGREACARRVERRVFQTSQDMFPLLLRKGANIIVAKVQASDWGSRFTMAIADRRPSPILSAAGDMLLPAANRVLRGNWGDPTNASVIWIYHPDQERAGIPFHHKGARFDLVDEYGYPGDLLVFDGYRVFGIGREQDPKRTPTAIFGKPAWDADLWFTPVEEHAERIRGALVAGDVMFSAFGGAVERGEQAETPPCLLYAHSAADGKLLGTTPLAATPRWDGMAAAPGRLYISADDGHVTCLAGK